MNIKTVHAVYFSGTGTTEKVVTTLAKDLAERLGAGYEACCFNLPEARKQALSFGPEDLAVVAPRSMPAGCPICCCPTFGI